MANKSGQVGHDIAEVPRFANLCRQRGAAGSLVQRPIERASGCARRLKSEPRAYPALWAERNDWCDSGIASS
jgi:hypothetical protein